MIVRIVQMTFRPEEVGHFLEFFESRKETIRSFRGCSHLELWQDSSSPNILFTYSQWESEADLNHYRFSGFFKDTWAATKSLFAEKPQAWSVLRKSVAGSSV